MKDNFVNRPLSKKLNRQNILTRLDVLESGAMIKPSSAAKIEDLSEITDEVNAAIIRAVDVNAGVVRMIMSGEDIYDGDVYNIHANLAGFNDAGDPTVWIDAQDGSFRAGGGNVGMDEDGYWIVAPDDAPLETNAYKFVDATGTYLGGMQGYVGALQSELSINWGALGDKPRITWLNTAGTKSLICDADYFQVYDTTGTVLFYVDGNGANNETHVTGDLYVEGIIYSDTAVNFGDIVFFDDSIVIGTNQTYAEWAGNSETGPGVFVQKTYSAGGTNEHGIIIADVFTNDGYAYSAFDAQYELTGSNAFDHSIAFQARPKYTATGYTGSMGSFVSAPDVTAGQVGTYKHFGMATTNASTNINHEYGLCLTNFTGYGDVWPIYVETNRNETVYLSRMLNTSASAAARSLSYWGESANQYIGLQYENSGRATIPNTGILKTGGSTTGGIIVQTNASGAPISFEINAVEVGRWNAAGLGIGTTPAASLDILAPAVTGREPIIRAKVSDGGNNAFFVSNTTVTDSVFVPAFTGFAEDTNVPLTFNGYTVSGGDSGTLALMQFIARRTSSATDPINGTLSNIVTRPLFAFRNGTVYVMQIDANGDVNIPGALIPGSITGWDIGSDVQAWDAQLDDIAALAVTDGNIIVGDGTHWVAESGATARTSLGVGSGDSPTFAGLTIGNGSINGTTPANIDDDTAISFTPTQVYGAMIINMRTSVANASGIFAYRTYATGARMEILAAGSNIETTTGVLSGTTGTDGKMTISAHTDGKIYIENRLGAARSISYTLLGA